jgi:hypothetical protein
MPNRRWYYIAGFCCAILAVSAKAEQTPSPAAQPPLPTWKDEIAKNYLPPHQLTVEDFPINDTAHPQAGWWVQPFVHYYYHYLARSQGGGMIYLHVIHWTVFSGFDKNLSSRNSKVRPADLKNELPYIQALFDITEVHARRLAALKEGDLPSAEGKTLGDAQAQLQDRLAAMVQIRSWEAQKETDAFAKTTNNGRDKKKVRELAAGLKKQLAEIPPGVPAETPAPH